MWKSADIAKKSVFCIS